jgi:hypothetical protein
MARWLSPHRRTVRVTVTSSEKPHCQRRRQAGKYRNEREAPRNCSEHIQGSLTGPFYKDSKHSERFFTLDLELVDAAYNWYTKTITKKSDFTKE